MNQPRVALPPELHVCVNQFLEQANAMQATQKYDAISASLLYAAARYNVHGFIQQGDAAHFSRADFLGYMTGLYQRMLDEQLDVLTGAVQDKPEADKPEADRPETDNPEADKPEADKPQADKPEATP